MCDTLALFALSCLYTHAGSALKARLVIIDEICHDRCDDAACRTSQVTVPACAQARGRGVRKGSEEGEVVVNNCSRLMTRSPVVIDAYDTRILVKDSTRSTGTSPLFLNTVLSTVLNKPTKQHTLPSGKEEYSSKVKRNRVGPTQELCGQSGWRHLQTRCKHESHHQMAPSFQATRKKEVPNATRRKRWVDV